MQRALQALAARLSDAAAQLAGVYAVDGAFAACLVSRRVAPATGKPPVSPLQSNAGFLIRSICAANAPGIDADHRGRCSPHGTSAGAPAW
mmetsp:Transcript_17257/g.33671  ORF Transcript_17257/g.33671 Transcript_17257/m.33671 type:complete len:90 (-) Transcript_17257:39-308(-)